MMTARRSRARRASYAAAAVALLLTGFVTSPSRAAAARAALGPVRDLVATVTGDRATISWRAPVHGDVARYQVVAHRVDDPELVVPEFGTRLAGASATSIVWPDLPLNDRFYFTVTPIAADGARDQSGPAGPYNQTGIVTAGNTRCSARGSGYCIVVDAGDRLGRELRPGAGLLHGTVPRSNPWAAPLRLTHWRIEADNPAQYAQATAQVPANNVIELLSDAWYAHSNYKKGVIEVAADPWADWARYTAFIARTVRAALEHGERPMWEIQNEPEYYPYSPVSPPTRAKVEEQYLQAYRAIKRVDPAARVVGPSIDWTHPRHTHGWYLDVKAFIPYAAAHHMRLYGFAWHENADTHDRAPLIYAEMPQAVRDEAEEVRELIAEHPGIGSPKLFVDENSSGAGQFIPGFTAGYLAAEDQAGITEANRSCWPYPGSVSPDTCFHANLGQLLNPDGKPNANYWVMRDYAAMNGSRVGSEVSDINLSALAVTAGSGTTRILLGRHQTCSRPTTGVGYCAGPTSLPPPVPTTVRVLLPAGATSARVGVQMIPNSLADRVQAPATVHSTVPVNDGVATVAIPALGDGAAVFLTITPNSAAGSATRSGDLRRVEVPAPRGAPRPTRLLEETGSNQSALALHPFTKPLRTLLTDQYGNPIAHAKVTFVLEGTHKGKFPGNQTAATVVTNADGLATAPAVTAGVALGRWRATAYVTKLGLVQGAPAAYFSLLNRLV